jgi:hypothetical protein
MDVRAKGPGRLVVRVAEENRVMHIPLFGCATLDWAVILLVTGLTPYQQVDSREENGAEGAA